MLFIIKSFIVNKSLEGKLFNAFAPLKLVVMKVFITIFKIALKTFFNLRN